MSARRAGLAMALVLATAACAPGPSPVTATPTPSPTPLPTPTPTAAPTPDSAGSPVPAPIPAGMVLVDVPGAGIRLPVPEGWERVTGSELADGAVKADITARYPGMDALLAAAESLGDRAAPALLALDPAAAGSTTTLAPSVSVLVAQPSVKGLLLDVVAGFIADGFVEAFGSGEPVRSRLATPVGDAVKLVFALPADGGGPDLLATAYVVGAEAGTLLVSVMGLAGEGPSADPDALMLAAVPSR